MKCNFFEAVSKVLWMGTLRKFIGVVQESFVDWCKRSWNYGKVSYNCSIPVEGFHQNSCTSAKDLLKGKKEEEMLSCGPSLTFLWLRWFGSVPQSQMDGIFQAQSSKKWLKTQTSTASLQAFWFVASWIEAYGKTFLHTNVLSSFSRACSLLLFECSKNMKRQKRTKKTLHLNILLHKIRQLLLLNPKSI